MNALPDFLSEPWVVRLGWVLIHFIWQGAAIGLLLAVILPLAVSASSHVRYLILAFAHMACSVAPVVTWTLLGSQPKPAALSVSAPGALDKTVSQAPSASVSRPSSPSAVQVPSSGGKLHVSVSALIAAASPYLVAVWLVGIVLLSLRLSVGWVLVFRIGRSGIAIQDPRIVAQFHSLLERMEITRGVRLLRSAWVEVPTLIGWLRPVILLPASTLTGLSRDHLEAILAHELAHVRRWDYLVNLLQTVVETILFYHPVVWWIGRRLREERENCCDDLALAVTQDRLAYAHALLQLEERRALAFTLTASGSLLQRVQRIVGVNEQRISTWSFLPVAVTLLLLGYLAVSHAAPSASPTPPVARATTAPLEDGIHVKTSAARLSLQRALNAASTRGDLVGMERLLASGADPNWTKIPLDRSALFLAADANQIEAVKLLLKHGADPNTKEGGSGHAAIEWILARGNLAAAKFLYDAGAKIPPERWAAANDDRAAMPALLGQPADPAKIKSAYKYAASMGHIEMVKLLEKISGKPIPGSFLMSAACSANIPMMEYILSQGADLPKDGGRAIDWAIIFYDQPESVRFLLSKGVDPNRVTGWNEHLLTSAQSSRVTKVLLEAGADPNLAERVGNPLTAAKDAESVRLMLAHGGDIKRRFGDNATLIEQVVFSRNANEDNGEALDELIKQGAEFDPQGNGAKAIVTAAFYGQIKTVRVLLDHGVSPNAHHKDIEVRSVLASAAYQGSPELLQLLLDRGANPSGLPEDTFSPLTNAAMAGNRDNIEVLLRAGASDLSPLHLAAALGDLPRVRELVPDSRNIDETDKSGNTPLSYAVRRGHVEVARFLLEQGANQNIFNRFGMSPRDFYDIASMPDQPELQWSVSKEEGARRLAAFRDLLARYPEDPNYRDSQGRTALHQAAFQGLFAGFRPRRFADANLRDKDGNPPLLLAALSPHARDISERITSYENYQTPQEKAIKWNISAAIANSLLKLGADPDLPMPDGQTVRTLAIAAAEKAHNAQLVSLLKSAQKVTPDAPQPTGGGTP